MPIKEILLEYNEKLKNKEQQDLILQNKLKIRKNEILSFTNKIIYPALLKLKEEFENVGSGRTAFLTMDESEILLTVKYEQNEEFAYKITTLSNEESFDVFLYIHHAGQNHVVIHGVQEKLLAGKNINNISQEEIISDFYLRYKKFMLSRV